MSTLIENSKRMYKVYLELVVLEGSAFWKAFFKLSTDDKAYSSLYHEASRRANYWDTCACCELKQERRRLVQPLNIDLCRRGLEFCAYISDEQYDKAEKVFNEIQVIVAAENADCLDIHDYD